MNAISSAPYFDSQATRLEGRKLELGPVVAGASIAVGRPTEYLSTIESLVADHPYSEPFWDSLARLLYATGRQTEALDRLATLRRMLLDELGLDPSPPIVELEHQILRQDPALVAGGAAVEPASDPANGAPSPTFEDVPRNNLPAPLTAYFDGEDRIATVGAMLADHRLVTLIGPGGVGNRVWRSRSAARKPVPAPTGCGSSNWRA